MTIKKLREYIKAQRDKAYNSLRAETCMMDWRESALHSSKDDGIIDFAAKLLNLINYGYEEAPQTVVEEAFKKRELSMKKRNPSYEED